MASEIDSRSSSSGLELFRTAADSAPALMWMSDDQGQIIFANQRFRTFFSVETDEMLGEGWRSFVHPDDVDEFHSAFLGKFERREPITLEVRVIHPVDGVKWLSCHGNPHFDGDGAFLGYVGLNLDVTDAVRARELIQQNEARLRLALDAGQLGDWVWDVQSDEVRLSDLAAHVFRVEPGRLTTWEALKALLEPEDAATAAAALDVAVHTRRDYSAEYRIRSGAGERWIAARGRPLYDDQANCTSMVGVVRDITAEKAAALALAESELRQRRINEATPECIKIVDRDGRLLHMNQSGLAMIEAGDFESVQGADTFSLVAPEFQDRWRENHARVLAGEQLSWEFEIIGLQGTRRRMETHAVPLTLPDGEIAQLAVTRDISQKERSDAALRLRTEQLEVLNRTAAAVAAELDTERVVQMVTDAGLELTGAAFGAFFYNVTNDAGESLMLYTLSGAERSQFDGFGHPRPTQVFAPTFKGEGVVRSDDITADPRYGKNPPNRGMPEGHLAVRSYLAVPVASRSGEVMGGLFFGHPDKGVFTESSERLMLGLAGQAAVAIDNARLFQAAQRANHSLEQRVQERTRELEIAHEALRQAQKMEAIGQLTGGIAHDFNNLLTVIRGSADLLRRPDLPEEKRGRYVDAISDTADRAAKLTGQLLAFARRQALKPELFDAAKQIQGIADMLRTVLGSRIQLTIDARCSDCFVEADAAQFETAIVNMAVNARDAMDGEGELKIEIAADTSDAGDDAVRVRVSDTGHGISPEQLDRIFEPFFTTKEVGKGTGLGLSQVYGFVKQSDGEVTVESDVDQGTTFTIMLKKAEPGVAPARARTTRDQESQQGGRVLVVEDNEDVGRFAFQMLSDLGFEVVLETNAAAALERLEQEDGRFDLVFSDVVMPGMDGVQFGRQVRERWPATPVVLTSGYSHVLSEDKQHGFPLLQKPYSVEALSKALHSAREEGA